MEEKYRTTEEKPTAVEKTYSKDLDSFFEIKMDSDPSRRDFLKLMGYSFAVGSMAACSAPPRKVIPYLIKPEEITPGVANWYASTCAGCSAGCGVLVKSRDGRPIKIEGNREHPLSKGGVCAVGQATVLSLYDPDRLKGPVLMGKEVSWEILDERMTKELKRIKSEGKKIAIISSTIISPTTRELIKRFLETWPGEHVVYDPISVSAIRKAHGVTHGVQVLPNYHLDRAEVIVNFGADFLGSWISPVSFTKQYSSRRKLNQKPVSRHIQFESQMTVTGSNADLRISIEAGDEGLILLWVLKGVLRYVGQKTEALSSIQDQLSKLPAPAVSQETIQNISDELWRARGNAVVLCGSNNSHQLIVNFINHLIGAYQTIIDIENPSYQRQGDEKELDTLIQKMKKGGIEGVIVYGVNPVYSYPDQESFLEALEKVPFKISFSPYLDETSERLDAICPDNHYLESWNDAEPVRGIYSLSQPVITPLFKTRSAQESLLRWMGKTPDYYEYLKEYWKKNLFTKQSKFVSFQSFWDQAVHDGVFGQLKKVHISRPFNDEAVAEVIFEIRKKPTSSGLHALLYQKVSMREGEHANNPWLQELPDPVSKVTWGNYAAFSPRLAKQYDLNEGDIVRLVSSEGVLELPVQIQPGQAYQTMGVALGFGRKSAGRTGNQVGQNAFPWLSLSHGAFQYVVSGVEIQKTSGRVKLALTQGHHVMEGRPIIKETTVDEYLKNPASGNEDKHEYHSLWKEHEYPGSRWGMAIDLNSCTGCGGCVVACQAENNVAVVGREEVARNREMHWLRIDRYYSGSDESPQVVHQPMLCQHCGHAPCETVCPTLATVHSSDGLNQQIYNRCVGTRYCANNCPYKVRRFNWFNNYLKSDLLMQMVLNPDVVVRSRGIMEKCTMCVQRIQEKQIVARNENRSVKDGEIKTACQQSCPADAIVFGDMNDPTSEVSRQKKDPRNYHVLAELKTLPVVSYLTKVRNRKESDSV